MSVVYRLCNVVVVVGDVVGACLLAVLLFSLGDTPEERTAFVKLLLFLVRMFFWLWVLWMCVWLFVDVAFRPGLERWAQERIDFYK